VGIAYNEVSRLIKDINDKTEESIEETDEQ